MNIDDFLMRQFRTGHVEVILPGGRRLVAGNGEPPHVRVEIADNLTLARIMAQPSLGVGEAYMSGRLRVTSGSIRDLVELALRGGGPNIAAHRPGPLRRAWARWARERNARRSARRNVHHHYDLSTDLYRAFLDADLQYSCAYFARPDFDLDAAQTAKKRHIVGKLSLAAGQRVLDIGCGWGGMALSIAAWTGANVEGVTLSEEQLRVARQRTKAAGLDHLARFSLTDYRDVEGPYDRIVSVGMFEHVGRPNYQAFFDQVAGLLKPDGVAVIHSIGRAGGPSTTDPFTAKYIFPGGYIPSLSEVLPAVERAGLWVTDIEILRLHYAETLKRWWERFVANRERIAALYDERFCRMWEFYLVGAEMGFRHGDHMNFQLQLARKVTALPITRGYMASAEEALVDAERRAA